MKRQWGLLGFVVGLSLLVVGGTTVFAAPRNSRNNQNSKKPVFKKVTPALNKSAIEILRDMIDRQYAYRDELDVDWDNLFRVYGPRMIRARTTKQFADFGADLFARSRDPLIWLSFDGGVNGSLWWAFEPNYNLAYLEKKVPRLKKVNEIVSVASFPDPAGTIIGYILIRGWPGGSEKDNGLLEAAFAALNTFQSSRGIIVDIRPSFGGSEEMAAAFAGCFIEERVVYAKHADRIRSSVMRFEPAVDHVLIPTKDRPHYSGEVAVLIGPQNTDASELFCLMMKQVTRCTLIGVNTRGSSDYRQSVELGNGVTASIPTRKFTMPNGSCFQGKGIAPDLEIRTTKAELKKDDPVLSAALKVLTTDQTTDKRKNAKARKPKE